MKNRRLFSLFFLFIMLLSTLLPPAAYAAEETAAAAAPEITSRAALLIDPATEEILYEKNIHERLYPASLTKIMSALLVFEAIDRGELSMDQMLTASETAISSVPYDASTANIKAGESLSVENLLYCMLVVSANEACNIFAEEISGSIDAFVEAMNAKAAELGCENTHFANANGLHDDDHYTTAWDLYLITKAAREHEDFMTICDTQYFTLPATEYNDSRTYYTTNYLLSQYRALGYLYQYAHGIKTGYTSNAGNCLISTASKNGRTLLGVILGADRMEQEDGSSRVMSFVEMVDLFEWGFDNFTRRTILTSDELVYELPVDLSERDFVVLHPAEDVERLLPNDLNVEDLTRTITPVSEMVDAPISAGDVLGEIVISYGDTVYATVSLLALTDVDASRLLVFRRNALEFIQRREVKIAAVVVVVLIIAILLFIKFSGRRRRRYGRSRTYTYGSSYRGRRR